MPSPFYPPLDTLKPVCDGIHIVDSVLPGAAGRVVGVRMTVIRLADGGLLLHSPTRFTPALHRELQELGPVRHMVAPNLAHWLFMERWAAMLPDATVWAAPGLADRRQVRRSGLRIDGVLEDRAPPDWGEEIALRLVPGGGGFREAALFHRPSRTLVLTDLVMNLQARKLPALIRPLARLGGMVSPDGMPPPYLRALVRLKRRAAAEAADRLLALEPARVIFAHGDWFREKGGERLRRSWRWLLPA
ncbi:DUF4336 domain-containing protein [Rhizosaccharibacter radicis]|uniref:DUF4336 domain-containing protein n=1 Tax=Rhizosaccharibacter radicis TaxID=2782605 RepID=A0ABT1VY67_9PROT|nr:DUF4336 domain-containing protein [Acetobacteraceae bacterium KSS12]